MKVLIKYRSPTCNPEELFMPLFLYTEPLDVVEEKDDSVVVQWNNNDFYMYEFKKEYIEKTCS